MLQNTRTQTYKVSSPSMKPTQIQHQIHLRNTKHKFRNTKVQAQEYKPKFKHKHKIRNTRAQIQEHKPIFQHKHKIKNTSTYPKNSNQNPNPNQDIDTNIIEYPLHSKCSSFPPFSY